ncbi:MAG: thiol:disulfide interchange protein DsbA/DsbL [Candidatus Competibacteraceae bacterium]|nr:thiol:disulfide interchange protein DsbA/DsbL [Candidatus Competibacteraceae bacterium]
MPHLLRRLLLILLAGVLPLAIAHAADSSAPPPPFQEGKDYIRLPAAVPPAAPDKAEVVELFSYTCPHCRDLEPTVREWLKRKPDNVVFTRIAVAFGANWEPSARAYYAAEALGVLDKVHQPLFDAIHREKRKLNTEDELAAFFAEQGVDQEAFRKAYKSFQTETQLRRGNQLAQRYGVRGVPAVIVNGQYDVRSPQMFEVVDFLIAKPAVPQS